MSDKISVIIVTRDRPVVLLHCLGSLSAQSSPPDEIVIIDNSLGRETREIVKYFAQCVLFPVRIFSTKKNGYPALYNLGLKKASHDWVAFIDDDCVADSDWLAEYKKKLKRSPADVFLGSSDTYYASNSVSLATYIFDLTWKTLAITGENISDYEVLDTKNIVFKKKFLETNTIRFDETRTVDLGSAQDSDFGMQVKEAGGQALFVSQAKVWHKDHTDIWKFFKRQWQRTRGHSEYEKRWSKQRAKLERSFSTKVHTMWKVSMSVFDRYNVSFISRCFIFALVCIAWIVRLFSRVQIEDSAGRWKN